MAVASSRLRELREEDGLSAAEIARRVDVDANSISRWENDRGQIPDWRKQQLAEFFGVSVAFLMGWDTEGLMMNLGRCPMCEAPIVAREDNPDARDPYVPATMWICERGCRVTQPDFAEVP